TPAMPTLTAQVASVTIATAHAARAGNRRTINMPLFLVIRKDAQAADSGRAQFRAWLEHEGFRMMFTRAYHSPADVKRDLRRLELIWVGKPELTEQGWRDPSVRWVARLPKEA